MKLHAPGRRDAYALCGQCVASDSITSKMALVTCQKCRRIAFGATDYHVIGVTPQELYSDWCRTLYPNAPTPLISFDDLPTWVCGRWAELAKRYRKVVSV